MTRSEKISLKYLNSLTDEGLLPLGDNEYIRCEHTVNSRRGGRKMYVIEIHETTLPGGDITK